MSSDRPVEPLQVGPATAADRDAVIRLWRHAGLTTAYNDPGVWMRDLFGMLLRAQGRI